MNKGNLGLGEGLMSSPCHLPHVSSMSLLPHIHVAPHVTSMCLPHHCHLSTMSCHVSTTSLLHHYPYYISCHCLVISLLLYIPTSMEKFLPQYSATSLKSWAKEGMTIRENLKPREFNMSWDKKHIRLSTDPMVTTICL